MTIQDEQTEACLTAPAITMTPAENYWLAERGRRVRQTIGSLSAAQQEAVEYAFIDGRSHREIAERLAVPLGTVKTRIRLGLQQCRDALTDVGGREAATSKRR